MIRGLVEWFRRRRPLPDERECEIVGERAGSAFACQGCDACIAAIISGSDGP